MNKYLIGKFDEDAENYDKFRKLFIPCFDDFYNITTDFANSNKNNPIILDLGAGTGLLTKFLFERYPEAEFKLIDMAEEMLKVAEKRFKEHENFKYIIADYTKYPFKDSYDNIVSSLSIHHLEDIDKQKLYNKVYNALNEEGVFINADQVIGSSVNVDKDYQRKRIEKINEFNLSEAQKNMVIERIKFDKPATLENNLKWLRNCGFEDVDVPYKYYNFCIFFGKK